MNLFTVISLLLFLLTALFFTTKIKNRIVKSILIVFIIILLFPVTFLCYFGLNTQDCYEREIAIKPTWENKSNDLGSIIYIENDSLFNVYYSINSMNKDTTIKLFLIDKGNGNIVKEFKSMKPKKLEEVNYYSISKETHPFSFGFDIEEHELVVTSNYKGYKITLNSWYKNIRTCNNSYQYLAIYKNNKLIKKEIFHYPSDIAWDNQAIYIASGSIMKFSFDSIIEK